MSLILKDIDDRKSQIIADYYKLVCEAEKFYERETKSAICI